MSSGCTGFFCVDLSNLFQIAFWITGGVVAILSYRQAKRSLFQPVRVEVFKLQLTVVTKIYESYALKGEVTLQQQFDIPRCVDQNALRMFESYGEAAFHARPSHPAHERFRDEFRGAMIIAMPDDLFELLGPPDPDDVKASDPDEPVTPPWSDYRAREIAFSTKHEDAVDELQAFRRDPLVPVGLVKILDELDRAVVQNLTAIRGALDEAAALMPRSYPNLDSLRGASVGWVANIWNRSSIPLEPIALRLSEFIREYLQSEEVGRTGKQRKPNEFRLPRLNVRRWRPRRRSPFNEGGGSADSPGLQS